VYLTILFIYVLFNNAANSSDYIVSNVGMTMTVNLNAMEGSCGGII
jgi:hypothetical protein